MIYKVKIFSRMGMDHFAASKGKRYPYFPFPNTQWGLISIYSSGGKEFLIPDTKDTLNGMGCKHMLSLQFDDITDETYKQYQEMYPDTSNKLILFNDEQAQQVVEFVKLMHESPDPLVFLAHCDAGISRSGAIGEFVTDYCGFDYLEYRSQNNVHPNKYVLRKLRENSNFYPCNYVR